jgi:hypothetical protein
VILALIATIIICCILAGQYRRGDMKGPDHD